MISRIPVLVMILSAACAVGACDRPKSEAQVAKDTASAERSAEKADSKAESTAAEKEASARADVNSEKRDLGHVDAVQAEKVADTEAEGARKVALARCEALSGSAQASCKDKANADYDVAEAKAKQMRASTDPKH